MLENIHQNQRNTVSGERIVVSAQLKENNLTICNFDKNNWNQTTKLQLGYQIFHKKSSKHKNKRMCMVLYRHRGIKNQIVNLGF